MRVIAINGSPRETGNTATLLDRALKGASSKGAETEMIHLYDLQYTGCVSCFACKQKHDAGMGRCAHKDELSPILEKIMECDTLLLGSPIYFNDVTGMMRSFLERLLFMNLTYDDPFRTAPGKRINSAFFFTMNLAEEMAQYYIPLFESNSKALALLGRFNRLFKIAGRCFLPKLRRAYCHTIHNEDGQERGLQVRSVRIQQEEGTALMEKM